MPRASESRGPADGEGVIWDGAGVTSSPGVSRFLCDEERRSSARNTQKIVDMSEEINIQEAGAVAT